MAPKMGKDISWNLKTHIAFQGLIDIAHIMIAISLQIILMLLLFLKRTHNFNEHRTDFESKEYIP